METKRKIYEKKLVFFIASVFGNRHSVHAQNGMKSQQTINIFKYCFCLIPYSIPGTIEGAHIFDNLHSSILILARQTYVHCSHFRLMLMRNVCLKQMCRQRTAAGIFKAVSLL